MPMLLRRPLAGLCIFLSLLLGGCISLGPDYQAPAVDVDPAWLDKEDPQISDEVTQDPEWW
mgnify:CR=1 FL=1